MSPRLQVDSLRCIRSHTICRFCDHGSIASVAAGETTSAIQGQGQATDATGAVVSGLGMNPPWQTLSNSAPTRRTICRAVTNWNGRPPIQ